MFKQLFLFVVLFCFSLTKGFCQYFEFGSVVGDTSIPQGGIAIYKNMSIGYLIGSATGTASNNNFKFIMNRSDNNGKRVFSIISDTVIAVKPIIAMTSIDKYEMYGASITKGYFNLSRFVLDSSGMTTLTLNNHYRLNMLDSATKTNPELHIKYIPDECFYIYGQSPYARDSSFIIWKLDTAGKMLWRQDYYDTCNSESFSVAFTQNNIFYSSFVYNKRMRGVHLCLMDMNGNILNDKIISAPLYKTDMDIRVQSITPLPDKSVLLGTDHFDNKKYFWPVLVKLDSNFDTIWHRTISIPTAKGTVDFSKDKTEITKIVVTADSNIAVWWYKSFYDNGSGYNMLRTYDLNGNMLSEISIDSVGKRPAAYADMIATSDGGFAFAGSVTVNAAKNIGGSYLLKLSKKVITSVEDPIQSENGISIYPNPAHEIIFANPGQIKINNLYLYNIQGREVYHSTCKTEIIPIEKKELPNGLYLLKMQDTDGRIYTKKIVFE